MLLHSISTYILNTYISLLLYENIQIIPHLPSTWPPPKVGWKHSLTHVLSSLHHLITFLPLSTTSFQLGGFAEIVKYSISSPLLDFSLKTWLYFKNLYLQLKSQIPSHITIMYCGLLIFIVWSLLSAIYSFFPYSWDLCYNYFVVWWETFLRTFLLWALWVTHSLLPYLSANIFSYPESKWHWGWFARICGLLCFSSESSEMSFHCH